MGRVCEGKNCRHSSKSAFGHVGLSAKKRHTCVFTAVKLTGQAYALVPGTSSKQSGEHVHPRPLGGDTPNNPRYAVHVAA